MPPERGERVGGAGLFLQDDGVEVRAAGLSVTGSTAAAAADVALIRRRRIKNR